MFILNSWSKFTIFKGNLTVQFCWIDWDYDTNDYKLATEKTSLLTLNFQI